MKRVREQASIIEINAAKEITNYKFFLAAKLIQEIIDKPKERINNMQDKYEDLVGEGSQDDFDFSSMKHTPEELIIIYRDLGSGRLVHDDKNSKEDKLRDRARQSWISLAPFLTVKAKHPDDDKSQRSYFDDLKFLARKGKTDGVRVG